MAFDVWIRSDKTQKSRHMVVRADSILEALEKIEREYPIGNGDYSCQISKTQG